MAPTATLGTRMVLGLRYRMGRTGGELVHGPGGASIRTGAGSVVAVRGSSDDDDDDEDHH